MFRRLPIRIIGRPFSFLRSDGSLEPHSLAITLQQHVSKGDHDRFCLALKDFSAQNPNIENKSFLYPFLSPQLYSKLYGEGISTFIWSLGKLGFQANHYHLVETSAINTLLTRYLNDNNFTITPKSFNMLMTGLCTLGLDWKYLDRDLRVRLLETLEKHIDSFQARQISNVLFSLNRCNVNWGHLTENLRNKFIKKCFQQRDHLNDLEGPLVLSSLGGMQFRLEIESKPIQRQFYELAATILETVYNTKRKDKNSTVIHVFSGLNILGSRFSHFLPEQQKIILKILDDQFLDIDALTLAILLQFLGRFEIHWSDLSSKVRMRFELLVIKFLATFDEEQLTMTLFGLAQLGLKFSDLTILSPSSSSGLSSSFSKYRLQQNLLVAIHRVYSDNNRRGTRAQKSSSSGYLESVPKIVYALGQFGQQYQDIPESAIIVLLGAFHRCQILNDIDMFQLLKGFSLMGAKWVDFDPTTQELIKKHVASPAPLKTQAENVTHVVKVFSALGHLASPWEEIDHKRLEHVLTRLKDQIDANSLLTLLAGLISMKATWSDVSKSFGHVILQKVKDYAKQWNIHQISEAMNIITLLTFDYVHQFEDSEALQPREKVMKESLLASHIAMLNSFKELQTSECSAEESNNIALYLSYLKSTYHTTQVDEILKELPSSLRLNEIPEPPESVLKLQQILSKKYDAKLSASILPYNVLPADVLIYSKTDPSKLVACIDIDSASTESHSSRLAKLKKFLYSCQSVSAPLLVIKDSNIEKIAKSL